MNRREKAQKTQEEEFKELQEFKNAAPETTNKNNQRLAPQQDLGASQFILNSCNYLNSSNSSFFAFLWGDSA
jgi:hypothetical protein